MTRTSTTLLALIAAANLALAGGPDPAPANPPQQGVPSEQTELPDVAEADEVLDEAPEQESTTKTVKGVLQVKRDHDEIDLRLKRYRLSANDKLPLSVLAGREVELVVEETGRGEARVINAVSPRGWTGRGVVRKSGDGLELINDTQRLKVVGLPEGVSERIVDKMINARGWVFPGTSELVFSGASARIIVATSKDGTPSETAYLNERTVDARGVATYSERHTLEPGTEVFVFDIAAYRRAERDAANKIVKPGVWRASLNDMVGPDILLVRSTVTQREGNGITGWIPLRKVSFGEIAPPRSQDPNPPAIVDVPATPEEVQSGLEGALQSVGATVEDPQQSPPVEATPDAVQGSLEEALGVELSGPSSDLDDLVDAANGDEVEVTLDPNAGQQLPPAEDPTLTAVEPEAPIQTPQVDIDLGEPVARTAMVIATELNVRSEPSGRSPALLVALHGESVKVLEDNGTWVKVELAPPTGYVYNRFLEPTGSAGKVRTFRVVPSHLKLRETPSMGDNVACYVLGGQELQAVGAKGGWIKIQQSEPVVGYVIRSALNLE
ncbi:MAG: SH3 domain-containing protein [Planctomycetes bacterium]|nr:SH3 domain-containing protein [Planctomycetota bacterium]